MILSYSFASLPAPFSTGGFLPWALGLPPSLSGDGLDRTLSEEAAAEELPLPEKVEAPSLEERVISHFPAALGLPSLVSETSSFAPSADFPSVYPVAPLRYFAAPSSFGYAQPVQHEAASFAYAPSVTYTASTAPQMLYAISEFVLSPNAPEQGVYAMREYARRFAEEARMSIIYELRVPEAPRAEYTSAPEPILANIPVFDLLSSRAELVVQPAYDATISVPEPVPQLQTYEIPSVVPVKTETNSVEISIFENRIEPKFEIPYVPTIETRVEMTLLEPPMPPSVPLIPINRPQQESPKLDDILPQVPYEHYQKAGEAVLLPPVHVPPHYVPPEKETRVVPFVWGRVESRNEREVIDKGDEPPQKPYDDWKPNPWKAPPKPSLRIPHADGLPSLDEFLEKKKEIPPSALEEVIDFMSVFDGKEDFLQQYRERLLSTGAQSVHIHIYDRKTKRSRTFDDDNKGSGGSGQKMGIVLAYLLLAQKDEIDLNARLRPTDALKPDRSTLDNNQTYSILELLERVARRSDNEASNLLLNNFGFARMNALMQELELLQTTFEGHYMPEHKSPSKNYKDNTSSDRDFVKMMSHIVGEGPLTGKYAALAQELFRTERPQIALPEGIQVWSKIGNDESTLTYVVRYKTADHDFIVSTTLRGANIYDPKTYIAGPQGRATLNTFLQAQKDLVHTLLAPLPTITK